MIDIAGVLAANFLYVILITLGGVLVSGSVHFVPVGGAPAAMAQATGIGTGTVQLAAGAGLTGLVTAGAMLNLTDSMALILAAGMVGAMIMIGVTMMVGNLVYVYGIGVPPASAKVDYDPITKDRQDIYVSQGTEGHGLPTVSFVSGIIGGGLGGIGGALVYYSLMSIANGMASADFVGLAAIFAVGIFFVNAVIPSYNIGGTIEGFHDPKFKKWPKAVVTSLIVTFMCAIVSVITIGGL
ncbi:tetrahydromethanopterin S-methyltransferase subunit D [Methanohalophilus portucalensis FDF-1]|jgi:tetrahydromethanopterin S-methyltransferase subunit D|uniref:Tetrahydromethanopterin S-methyltransferase subunit D n=2 Tax=Methanohalophilus portucalensis TaxID=39664 RepID=A0A1L9C3G4_9EURY|nr:tetrahydromethanopterin S-methyltransferase subunit D [Methanohalophilus portucalensis]ATU07462.1 tetrahydromethanopterin S-methyltransferase subunit D [Methanohalophilus portucalensis]OJH49075.1 tetrahydromethanopterin S-methyltransferase, subunit D [Methanohalophilus portucalensis FDF-1]RNI10191.1 tetrahydromethanopterin S-methyltransferase subunit D [Methanohalophilus portucalensis FDF-1]SMH39086.1 tetrahydromethanopterin S-methyltransferase, subunit D [Methanohalophilus portucalensis FDF